MSQDLISEYILSGSNEHWIINDFKTNIRLGFTISTYLGCDLRTLKSAFFFFCFQFQNFKIVTINLLKRL